jgi:hypothetical protein
LAGMEETNSEEIAVSDAAGAAGVRGEEVDISATSADELRLLIVHEHWERAVAKLLTATTSIITQGEPGPLTSRGQTGFFLYLKCR